MAAESRAHSKSQLYLALVAAVVFAGVTTVVVMSSPGVRAAIVRNSVDANAPVPDLSKDPRIGSLLAIPTVDAFGTRITLTRKTLLVYAGPCTECTERSFKPEEIKGRFESMIVVFDADPKLLPKHYLKLGKHISVIGDPQSELAAKLNAQWFPRFYLLDSNSKLISIQTEPGRLPNYVERFTP
jgi:hypothetical protein